MIIWLYVEKPKTLPINCSNKWENLGTLLNANGNYIVCKQQTEKEIKRMISIKNTKT